VITGGIMIRLEDKELEQRFGAEYQEYRRRVPAVVPRENLFRDGR
jgi:protein-S-isoprenylcysteine O-methyltransferase Ste14